MTAPDDWIGNEAIDYAEGGMTAPEVKVTQADRDAAAANILARLIMRHGGEQQWMDASTHSMRMGEQDNHWEVQAFARHRATATAPLEARIALLEGGMREAVGALDRATNEAVADDMDDWFAHARTTLASLSAMLEGGK